MATRGGLKRNVVANLGGYAISILIAFVLTPIIIRSLGDARFGIWSLVAQLTGYYGLLDLGIRGAISHYVARYLATDQPGGVRSSLSSGFWLLAVMGVVALLVGAALTFSAPYIFNLADAPVADVRMALAIMSLVVALNLPLTTLSGALVGHERLEFVNGIEIVTSVAAAAVTYAAMKSGGGLVALALIQGGRAFGRWMLTVVFLHRVSGGFSISPRQMSRRSVKELGGYAGRTMAVNLSMMLIDRTDLIVISIFLDTTYAAFYTIGQQLVAYFSSAGASVTFAFTPRLTHLAAQENRAELERVYLLGARTSASLLAPMAACMLAFGTAFIGLWLGDKYVTGDLAKRSDVIMALLLVANLPRMLQSISRQLLFATRQQAFLAKITVGEAVVNLGLSLILIRSLGLIGVALGTLIPLVLTQIVLLPRFVSYRFGFHYGQFIVKGIGRPVLVGAGVYFVGFALTRIVPPTSWTAFFAEATATAAVGALLLYLVVLDAEERGRVRGFVSRALTRSE